MTALPNGVSRSARREEGPRPAVGHMPFEGHRAVAQVWEQQERVTQLAWCPPEHRDLFRLLRSKLNSSADARRMIEDLIDKERSTSVLVADDGRSKADNGR